mmetsp:Transcript_3408/g.5752  ORF Transcript_3408/g.5752 Transcript_3408/m.5752 type:complete len:332 (+) Transcript_3408:841-1836(+)
MTKPLTVQSLNQMFSEKQDVFEYPQERADWTYPKYVKFQKGKLRQESDLQSAANLSHKILDFDMANNIYEDDNQYLYSRQLSQINQNAQSALMESNPKGGGLDSSTTIGVLQSQGALISVIQLMCSLVYYNHFNYNHGLLRLAYFIFLVVYPVACLLTNLVIGNTFSRVVLQGQDELPQNAEFLDYEDTDQDILRKAKILAVKRKVGLQRFVMPCLFVTGFFKLLSEKDFGMQIYCGYVVELFGLTLPVLIIQCVNNTLMDQWKFELYFSSAILLINLVIGVKGVLSMGDKLQQEENDMQRKQLILKHQRQKQKILEQQMLQQGINATQFS